MRSKRGGTCLRAQASLEHYCTASSQRCQAFDGPPNSILVSGSLLYTCVPSPHWFLLFLERLRRSVLKFQRAHHHPIAPPSFILCTGCWYSEESNSRVEVKLGTLLLFGFFSSLLFFLLVCKTFCLPKGRAVKRRSLRGFCRHKWINVMMMLQQNLARANP